MDLAEYSYHPWRFAHRGDWICACARNNFLVRLHTDPRATVVDAAPSCSCHASLQPPHLSGKCSAGSPAASDVVESTDGVQRHGWTIIGYLHNRHSIVATGYYYYSLKVANRRPQPPRKSSHLRPSPIHTYSIQSSYSTLSTLLVITSTRNSLPRIWLLSSQSPSLVPDAIPSEHSACTPSSSSFS